MIFFWLFISFGFFDRDGNSIVASHSFFRFLDICLWMCFCASSSISFLSFLDKLKIKFYKMITRFFHSCPFLSFYRLLRIKKSKGKTVYSFSFLPSFYPFYPPSPSSVSPFFLFFETIERRRINDRISFLFFL